ncbi:septum formation initiator [Desulfosporosinus fructosivorans]|uniref:Septum formation initiator n=1 Tax=Desulfosporosinus fructosivorans TaxID=2018669 RepID=A0A4Z0RC61_9FIRM|nr:septum formation initiator [Desulfosporosinus fructosivorans]TGE40044.1 septum formation initiator [Desulfosporosinus fructosivorans]
MVVAQEKIEWQEPLTQKSNERNPRRTRKGGKFAKVKSILGLALIVGLTGAIGATTIQLTVVQGAEVRTLENEISTIKARKDLLQMEADKLRAVGRIESAALAMGMEKPAGIVYVAGTMPTLKNQKVAPSTQAATQPIEVKLTALQQFSKIFTSFFASTQR